MGSHFQKLYISISKELLSNLKIDVDVLIKELIDDGYWNRYAASLNKTIFKSNGIAKIKNIFVSFYDFFYL